MVFGPLGTLQNVAVISWMHITPVVGFRLLVLVCCWPVVGVPVVMPVVTPVVMPSALAALLFASWLFAVAFVGEVCACTLGAANTSGTKTSEAIKTNFFMGPTRSCCGLAATLWDVSSTPLLPVCSKPIVARRAGLFKNPAQTNFLTAALRGSFPKRVASRI